MRRLVIALTVLVALGTPCLASAGTLTTPMFPGPNVNSGVAVCAVCNGGKSTTFSATCEMLNSAGEVIATDGPFELTAGDCDQGTFIDLSSLSPSSCRCNVPGKHSVSFQYINGTTVEVITGVK